jgi:hypothetical protein
MRRRASSDAAAVTLGRAAGDDLDVRNEPHLRRAAPHLRCARQIADLIERRSDPGVLRISNRSSPPSLSLPDALASVCGVLHDVNDAWHG